MGNEYKLQVGTLVYICDYLQAKNPHSILSSIAKITHVADGGRNYQLRLLNNRTVTRHLYSLIPTACNANYFNTSKNIDIFCLPTAEEVLVPSMTRSKFDNFLDTFDLTGTKPYSDNVILPVADDEQNFRFDSSRSRDVRPCLDDVPVPVLSPLPEEDVDPHIDPPEEDVHIKELQRNVDNSPSVRPKEF